MTDKNQVQGNEVENVETGEQNNENTNPEQDMSNIASLLGEQQSSGGEADEIFEKGANYEPTDNKQETEGDNNEGDKEVSGDSDEGEEKQQEGDEQKKDEQEKTEEKEVEKKPESEGYYKGKYKTLEDFESAHRELERAYTKARQELAAIKAGQLPIESNPNLKNLLKTFEKPVVDVEPPNPQDYQLGNEFDIASYLRDWGTKVVTQLQKELIAGSLAAAQFSVVNDALKSIVSEEQAELERSRRAETVMSKIYEEYPVIKDNEFLQKTLAALVSAESQERELSEDDIIKLAGQVAMNYAQQQKQEQESETKPAEKISPTPQISEKTQPTDKLQDAVMEIFEESKKASEGTMGIL